MNRTLVVLALAALFVVPAVEALPPRAVTKDYTYLPGATTGCGAISPNEVCFPVLAGETGVQVHVADDAGLAVPFTLLAAAPGAGNVALGIWCGGTDGLVVGLPAGTRSLRVNFQVDAIAACGSVGTTGSVTATFT